MSTELILKAAAFAAHKHKDQRRKGAEASPYINHPIGVAKVIAEIGGVDDANVIAAALLHDTLEDTQTSSAELEQAFGSQVTAIVQAVTDDKTLAKHRRKELQIEHAAHLSSEAALVKIADKICNVGDMIDSPPKGWSIERRTEYIEWAMRVVGNCANANPALKAHFDALAVMALRSV
ncbi:MAG: HD domain-containing protein [Proteobacteria bacterium]|nr:HD domain-containing protein [Pseudomonadota bacterium]